MRSPDSNYWIPSGAYEDVLLAYAADEGIAHADNMEWQRREALWWPGG